MIEQLLWLAGKMQDRNLLYMLADGMDILPDTEKEVVVKAVQFFKTFKIVPRADDLDLIQQGWGKTFCAETTSDKEVLTAWWKQTVQKRRVASKIRDASIALDSGQPADGLLLQAARLAGADYDAKEKELLLNRDWKSVLEVAAARDSEYSFISTGIRGLDKAIGGLHRDEASITMTPTNRGKSMFLVHTAYHSLIQGLKVLAVTLEITADRWMQRLLQRIGKSSNVRELNTTYKPFIEQAINLMPGSCIVRYMPSKQLSLAKLESMIDQYSIKDFHPDVVIIDYLDEMYIPPREALRMGLREVAQGFTHLAKQFNCHMATATQTNRAALGKTVITEKDVGEDYGKIQVADVVLALCMTNEEYENKQGRFYVCKDRNGSGRGTQVPVRVEFGKALFEDLASAQPRKTIEEMSKPTDNTNSSGEQLDWK